ncbi:hypothetical protein [Thermaurantiacus sp.]
MRRLGRLGLALAALQFAPPAEAQTSSTYRTRTVVVYGDDPCPKSENPDEIIVCARRPEEERYRIPKALRDLEKAETIAPEDNVAAQRAALASGRPAATGTGSCSTVGPGGITGCTAGIDIAGAVRTVKGAIERAAEPTDD